MSEARLAGQPRRGLARGLCLAASPTFALMALVTAVGGGGPMDMVCAAGHGSLLGGMVPMYLLMSAFHAAPWLQLVAGRGALAGQPGAAAADGRQTLAAVRREGADSPTCA